GERRVQPPSLLVHLDRAAAPEEAGPRQRRQDPRVAGLGRGPRVRAHPLPGVRLAARAERSVVLFGRRHARAAVHVVRHRLEYVLDPRPLSRLPAPVAMDILPALPRVVPARGLVRRRVNPRILESSNPESPIPNPESSIPDPQSSILNPRSSILDPQSSILDPRSIDDSGLGIGDPRLTIPDWGLGIRDPGIRESVSWSVRMPRPGGLMSYTRRTFLTAATGLVVGARLAAARAQGANDRIRIGVIGTGGRALMSLLKRLPGNDMVAVCDVYEPRLLQASEIAGSAAAKVGDYRRILDNREIDAVVIGTPDHWHKTITLDAVAAGKDVYVEKPVSHTLAEGAEMVRAIEASKQIVQTGTQQRSWDHFVLGKQLIDSGRLGQITFVHTYWYQHATAGNYAPVSLEQ